MNRHTGGGSRKKIVIGKSAKKINVKTNDFKPGTCSQSPTEILLFSKKDEKLKY